MEKQVKEWSSSLAVFWLLEKKILASVTFLGMDTTEKKLKKLRGKDQEKFLSQLAKKKFGR